MRSSAQQHPRLVSDSERPGAGVGAILRGARLARDEELQEVASALRIRLPYLQAIEEGRIEDLPGVTYGIGFVRGYAEYLGLDAADIVSRFKLEARGIDKRTQLHFPEPLPGNRVPGGALLLLVLILAGGVYGGWLYTTSQNMTFTEAVEALPQRFQAMLSGDEPAGSPPQDTTTTETALVTPPAAPEADLPAASPPAASEQPASAAEPGAVPPPATDVDTAAPVQQPVPATTGTPAARDEAVQPAQNETSIAESATPDAPVTDETAVQPESPRPEAIESPAVEALQTPTETQSAETVGTADGSQADPTGGAAADTTIPTPEPETAVETTSIAPANTEQTAAAPEASAAQPEASENVETAAPLLEAGAPAASSIVTEELPAPPPEVQDSASTAATAPDATSMATETATAPAAAESEASATPNAAPPATSGARIIIQATNESWIQVVDAQGDVLIEKLMLMGEIYRVPDREGLTLNTGNAGALKLIVNGTLIPPLSTEPEVMRNVDLSPQSLMQ